MQKRIAKFPQYDSESGHYLVSCKRVIQVQKIIGVKMTYIKCASTPKLYEFYSKHNFVSFGEREKENDELTESPVLVQMLRYFKN